MITFYLFSVLFTLIMIQCALYISTSEGMKFTVAQVATAVIVAFLPILNLVIIFKSFTMKEPPK